MAQMMGAEEALDDFERRVREVRGRLARESRELWRLHGESYGLAERFDRVGEVGCMLRLDGVRQDVELARDAVRLACRVLDDVGI